MPDSNYYPIVYKPNGSTDVDDRFCSKCHVLKNTDFGCACDIDSKPPKKGEIARKIIVLETEGGKVKETVFEDIKETKKYKKRQVFSKPNKEKFSLIKLKNSLGESLEICRYRGSPFLNMFIHGSVHDLRFTISRSQVMEIIKNFRKQSKFMWKAINLWNNKGLIKLKGIDKEIIRRKKELEELELKLVDKKFTKHLPKC